MPTDFLTKTDLPVVAGLAPRLTTVLEWAQAATGDGPAASHMLRGYAPHLLRNGYHLARHWPVLEGDHYRVTLDNGAPVQVSGEALVSWQ